MNNRETHFLTSLLLGTNKTKFPIALFGLATLMVVNLTSLACGQSGSRSSASTTQTSPVPASTFSSPTNFTPPIVSAEAMGLPTQGFSEFAGQTLTPQQMPQQFSGSQPSVLEPSSSSSTAGSPSRSIGIPAAEVIDPIFEINDPYSTMAVDHSAWDQFLACYLITDRQGLNRVRYGSVSVADRQQLESYLGYLQSVDVRTLNRDQQLAYWFNLYNAKIVDVVLTHYPVRSIRQIKQNFTDFVGPFDDAGAVNVLGKSLSLSDIESGIIRPIYKDPRVHYALNCASFSCPNLASTAWTAENLDARLNGAAISYINSGRSVKSGLRGLRLSKIYKWYKDDFGGTDEAITAHLQQYANSTTCCQIQNARGRIAGHFYDWSLNDAKITRRRLLEPLIR